MAHGSPTRILASVATDRREYDPTYSLDRHIAEARQSMGEARWAELNAEWEAPATPVRGRNAARLWARGER